MLIEYVSRFVYEITSYRKYDGVITLTDDEKEKIKPYIANDKIHVINTGVDCEDLKTSRRRFRRIENDPMLLYVGYYGHYPNVDAVKYFTEDIFPRIQRVYPRAVFMDS